MGHLVKMKWVHQPSPFRGRVTQNDSHHPLIFLPTSIFLFNLFQTSKDRSLAFVKEGISVVANEIVTDLDDSSEQIKNLLVSKQKISMFSNHG